MKKKPCKLVVGTFYKMFDFGEFESITKCKKYVSDCITCYHEIWVKDENGIYYKNR